MTAPPLVIAFSPDFSEDDIRVHVALCREYSSDLAVSTRVLRALADVDSLVEAHGASDAVVWNLYMEVDEVSRRLSDAFGSRLVGSNHPITSNTVRKSSTHAVLERFGIETPWSVVLDDASAVDALDELDSVPFPVIVKVDRGYNSIGLSASSICHDRASLTIHAREILLRHGPIVVQRFIAGREFTVAVANHRAFKPVEKIFDAVTPIYLPDVPYSRRYCSDPELEAELRSLATRIARAFGMRGTEYCRIDVRQDPETHRLYPLDVNDMCSVWPNSQFEASLAGDGVPRTELVSWLTTRTRYRAARSRIAVYVVWHSDLSQLENLLPFFDAFDCEVFLYPWNDCYDAMAKYFAERLHVVTRRFDIDGFMARLEREERRVVVMFTSSLSYPFGTWMKKIFETVRAECPRIIDVVCVGHCLDHSSCSSCLSDVGDVPLKMTAYLSGRLPYGEDEIRAAYRISARTILVSPTTGDDDIVLADPRLLECMKRLQDTGRFEFLFKLHPSTLMMPFDDVYFQREKAGYAYVREHFRIVDNEHFSVFPIAALVAVHVTDLFSSMPAILTHFGDRVILAKDNPAVRADHPIRPYLHVFDSAEEFEVLLGDVASLGTRNNAEFRRRHFLELHGDEDMQIAAARGWLDSAAGGPSVLAAGWRERVKAELLRLRRESESRRRSGEIEQEELDDILSALGEWMPPGKAADAR